MHIKIWLWSNSGQNSWYKDWEILDFGVKKAHGSHLSNYFAKKVGHPWFGGSTIVFKLFL
jgi:hypothetical protein